MIYSLLPLIRKFIFLENSEVILIIYCFVNSGDIVENADKSGEITKKIHEKQDQLFEQLGKEYDQARMTTHTQRGVGFGFTSSAYVQSYMQTKQSQEPK